MDHQYSQFRIVADSAADLTALEHVPFAAAPLKIITSEKEYLDDAGLDIGAMVDELKNYKGRSTSSCPNAEEWLKAFGDGKFIFGVTLTSGISGSFNAAQVAKELYEAEHPDRHVFLIDSLSAGPGETILVERLQELICSGLAFEDICREIQVYQKKTGLWFMLESLTNFANNGRVNPAVAKLCGVLGICIVGKASEQGTLEPVDKCRGQRKALDAIVTRLKQSGFRQGKLLIAHCFNENGALALRDKIWEAFPNANIRIYKTNGLCSFYAEKGGLLVGYDTL